MRRQRPLGRHVPLGLAATILAGLALVAPPAGSPARATSPLLPGAVNRTSLLVEARYDVRVTLRLASGKMSVSERISITNRSGGPIDHLLLNTVLARLGKLRITSAAAGGHIVRPTISDQTVRLPLGGVLEDGATVDARLTFSAAFPARLDGSYWMFTRAAGTYAAYRWIPWVSVARRFDRPNHGDPFMTASSPSVRLTVTSDRTVRIATSGRRTAVSGRTQVFEAENVRDFTFVADPSFGLSQARVGDTRVRAYARSASRRTALLAQATRALRRLESVLGPYPWPVLTIAETAGGYGVESPGAVWIPRGYSVARLPWLVTHEVAHQWFYGLVGNDQAGQPFADEAPADYLARYFVGSLRGSGCARDTLDRSIYRYSSACYFEVVYVQGSQVLSAIHRRIGSPAFFRALRGYLAAHRNGFGSTRELLAALDAVDPVNLAVSLRPRFPRIL